MRWPLRRAKWGRGSPSPHFTRYCLGRFIDFQTGVIMQRVSSIIAKTLPLALTAAFVFSNAAIAQNQLTAVKVAQPVAQPPKLEALASDPAWAKAAPLTVKLSSGANFKD